MNVASKGDQTFPKRAGIAKNRMMATMPNPERKKANPERGEKRKIIVKVRNMETLVDQKKICNQKKDGYEKN